MNHLKQQFIEFAIQHAVIRFGEFRLKSDRISPYFFNLSAFTTGDALGKLGMFYGETILNTKLNFEMLFGPAYKGIPLAITTAIYLHAKHQKNIPYACNRKETKTYGEGGNIIGSPLMGRVFIVDDVITAGTAMRESLSLIQEAHATPVGIVIALDRQEKGLDERSAVQEVEQTYQIPVISIIQLQDILVHLKNAPEFKKYYPKVMAYQQQYGISV